MTVREFCRDHSVALKDRDIFEQFTLRGKRRHSAELGLTFGKCLWCGGDVPCELNQRGITLKPEGIENEHKATEITVNAS